MDDRRACRFCGQTIEKNAKICLNCGKDVREDAREDVFFLDPDSAEQPDLPNDDPDLGPVLLETPDQAAPSADPYDLYHGFSMRWHFLLTRFILWLAALIWFSSGILSVAGIFTDRELSAVVPALRTLDTVFGLFFFAVGAYCGLTALALIRLKRPGPKMLCASFAVQWTITVVYSVAKISAIPDEYLNSDRITALLQRFSTPFFIAAFVFNAAVLLIHLNYYRKRDCLFN